MIEFRSGNRNVSTSNKRKSKNEWKCTKNKIDFELKEKVGRNEIWWKSKTFSLKNWSRKKNDVCWKRKSNFVINGPNKSKKKRKKFFEKTFLILIIEKCFSTVKRRKTKRSSARGGNEQKIWFDDDDHRFSSESSLRKSRRSGSVRRNENFSFVRWILPVFSEEIISEYDGKIRRATEKEEEFRKRIENNAAKQSEDPTENLSPENFYTPNVEPPSAKLEVSLQSESNENEPTLNVEQNPTKLASPIETTKNLVRNNVNQETTEPEFRSTVRIIPSRVLQSTIQNYLVDRSAENQNEGNSHRNQIFFWTWKVSNRFSSLNFFCRGEENFSEFWV